MTYLTTSLSLSLFQCDRCQKWRLLPMWVDVGALGEGEWKCEMNVWDKGRDYCDAKEQVRVVEKGKEWK